MTGLTDLRRARTGFIRGFDIKPIRRFGIPPSPRRFDFTSTRWSNFKSQALCARAHAHVCVCMCVCVNPRPRLPSIVWTSSKAIIQSLLYIKGEFAVFKALVGKLWGQIRTKSLLLSGEICHRSHEKASSNRIYRRHQLTWSDSHLLNID